MVDVLKSRKDVVISIGILILVGFITMYTHNNNQAELARLNRKLDEEREKTNLLLELKATSKKAERLEGVLFASDTSDMIKHITRLLEKEYIVVDSLTPDMSTSKEGVEKIYVKANIQIGYKDLIKFLRNIEGLKELIVIESVELRKSRDYYSTQKLSIKLNMYTIKK